MLREQIADPPGIIEELYFGVPAIRHDHRPTGGGRPAARPRDSLFFTAAPSIQPSAESGNRPDYLAADVPCAGTMTARALARVYAALIGEIDGVRPISPERTARISTVIAVEADRVLGVPIPKGLGYFLGLREMGGHTRAFGGKGSGGSIAFADPAHGFSFALTHNRMAAPLIDLAAQIAGHVRDPLKISL